MLIDNYADLKDFAFIPDRALDSYRRLTNASETAYAIRQKLNTEYITLASEEDSIRIVMKQDSSVVTDITRANLIYLLSLRMMVHQLYLFLCQIRELTINLGNCKKQSQKQNS